MNILLIGFLIVACSLNGQTTAPGTASERVRSLTLKMRILKIEGMPNDGLRIAAKAESDAEDWELVINIPGGEFKKGDRSPSGLAGYKFPVLLEPTRGKESLDRLLSTTFGKGAPATLFKPRGYSGSAFITPTQLGRKGGELTLFDPGIDGTIYWTIRTQLNPKEHTLSMKITEASY